jgi:hypothetical protein
MLYFLNLLLDGARFVRLSGSTPDGIQVVEVRRGHVYSTVGCYPLRATWGQQNWCTA